MGMIQYDRKAMKRLMVARGLDYKEVANRARLAFGTVRYMELGVTEPKASTLAKIANVLGAEVQDFFVRKAA